MAVSIAFGGVEATVTNGRWRTKAKPVLPMLKLYKLEGIRGYAPWPDYALAELTAKAIGGVIIKATNRPKYVNGRVY